MINDIVAVIEEVEKRVPLVQAITNYVTIRDCANILLAFGASPAMCEASAEVLDFTQIADSLYINLGTLTMEQEKAIIKAGQGAKKSTIPVTIDPVGCGAIPNKIELINQFSSIGKIDIIKGNMGEIKTLAGESSQVRGMDSIAGENSVESAARAVARQYNCVVAATGSIDVITDGERVVKIANGTEMFTKISGAGCMVGALCAATAAVCKDYLLAAAAAIMAMNVAGEVAAKLAGAPASFQIALIDSIYSLKPEEIGAWGRLYE